MLLVSLLSLSCSDTQTLDPSADQENVSEEQEGYRCESVEDKPLLELSFVDKRTLCECLIPEIKTYVDTECTDKSNAPETDITIEQCLDFYLQIQNPCKSSVDDYLQCAFLSTKYLCNGGDFTDAEAVQCGEVADCGL